MDVILCRGMRFASNFGISPTLATKNFLDAAYLMRYSNAGRWRFKLLERHPHHRYLSCNYVSFLNHIKTHEVPFKQKFYKNIIVARNCNTKATKECTKESTGKLSVFGKMKQLAKDHWRVFLPVHIITSVGWFTAFYLAITNGLDIAHVMKEMHFAEKYVDMIQNNSAGNIVLAYLLYKLATPARYFITIVFATAAIKQLRKAGLVKQALQYGKELQAGNKTTELNKSTAHKQECKIEPQKESPKL